MAPCGGGWPLCGRQVAPRQWKIVLGDGRLSPCGGSCPRAGGPVPRAEGAVPRWRGLSLVWRDSPKWLTGGRFSSRPRVFATNCPRSPLFPPITHQNALFPRHTTPYQRKNAPFAAHSLTLRSDLPRGRLWTALPRLSVSPLLPCTTPISRLVRRVWAVFYARNSSLA
jgi:hypothetical protein